MPITYNKMLGKIRIFYFVFIFFIFVLIGVSFFNGKSGYAGTSDTMRGWLWSSNAGWISLNSANCDGVICTPSGVDYGVTIDGNNVEGEAWSMNYGWICFGQTCADWGNADSSLSFLLTTPQSQPPAANFDGTKFMGWANVIAFKNDGWVKLQGNAVAKPGTYPVCFNCNPADSTCKSCFSGANLAGNICYNCTGCNLSADPDTCADCNTCNQYGMIANSGDNLVYGWAWGGTSDNSGIGWIKASGEYGVMSSPYAWLETKYSNIYAQKGIQAKGAPAGHYNATYCIHTSGILTAFSSANGCELTSDALKPGYEEIMFPKSTNLYTNILGKIDRTKILSGKLGVVDTVTKTTAKAKDLSKLTADPVSHEKVLAGGIYHFEHDLDIDKSFKFKNGNTESGSGLVVVDGDLIIEQNMTYDTSTVTKIRQLASVGWIVKGNLRISGNVTEIVGAFYVEGDDGNGTNAAVYTAASGATGNLLKVYGLMIAPNYSFQRTYTSTSEGAEQIIYDGRALVNTPPGMQDLTKSLPIYREAAP